MDQQTSIVEAAKLFAVSRHGKQLYGEYPYSIHLDMVATLTRAFCHIKSMADVDKDTVEAAAWLHDVLEDTNTTLLEIDDNFGEEVGDLVHAVTDEFGENRKERKAKTYKKTRCFGKVAVFLKIIDRICNVNFCRHKKDNNSNSASLFKMYKREAQEFRLALYDSTDGLEILWELLDRFYED